MKEITLSKEIEKIIKETGNAMIECSICKILAEAEVLKQKDFNFEMKKNSTTSIGRR